MKQGVSIYLYFHATSLNHLADKNKRFSFRHDTFEDMRTLQDTTNLIIDSVLWSSMHSFPMSKPFSFLQQKSRTHSFLRH